MFDNDISIDLGTATVLVCIKNKGIVLNEPSVIAVNTDTNEVCGVGSTALKMMGRTPPNIKTVRPLNDGVISNLTLTQEMIKAFLSKIFLRVSGSSRVMMCVPSGITNVEQRAVIEAARDVGAKDIYVIEEPVAAALGAGYDISRPKGTMIVDIGGGTTDIAVMALGGTVVSRSLKIAGDEFTEAVVRYMRRKKNLMIGPRTAERIKCDIGCVIPRNKETICEAKGIDSVTGLPKGVVVSSNELCKEFDEFVFNICARAHEVLEETPPELHGDIIDDGIIMTGGGSLIYGLEKRISESTGVKCRVADHAVDCVVLGAEAALTQTDTVTDPMHIFYKKAYIRE